jgi:hypothetical protein
MKQKTNEIRYEKMSILSIFTELPRTNVIFVVLLYDFFLIIIILSYPFTPF